MIHTQIAGHYRKRARETRKALYSNEPHALSRGVDARTGAGTTQQLTHARLRPSEETRDSSHSVRWAHEVSTSWTSHASGSDGI